MMTSAPAAPLRPWHSSTAGMPAAGSVHCSPPPVLTGQSVSCLIPGRLGLMAVLALAALLVWQRVTGSRSAMHLSRAAVLCISQAERCVLGVLLSAGVAAVPGRQVSKSLVHALLTLARLICCVRNVAGPLTQAPDFLHQAAILEQSASWTAQSGRSRLHMRLQGWGTHRCWCCWCVCRPHVRKQCFAFMLQGGRLASTGHLSFRPNSVGQVAFWRDAASSAALLTAEGLAMPTGSTAELLGLQLQYLQFLRSSETIEALKAKPPPMPTVLARV